MTTVKGYKLVCELCGCESEEIWGTKDPDELKLVTKEYWEDYKRTYDSRYGDYESFNREISLPYCWQSDTLTKKSNKEEDRYMKVDNPFLNMFSSKPLYEKTYTYFIGDEEKPIYFCCEAHKEAWKRLRKNCDEGWK